MRHGVPAVLLLAAALAACAGPRPGIPSSAAVAEPLDWRSPAGTGDAVQDGWWHAFGDPVLDRLIERAQANNTDILTAAARVEEARAQFRLARSAELPTLDLQGGGGPQRALNAFGIGTNQTPGQAQAVASYDLDLFGRLREATAASRASLLSTEAAGDTVKLAITGSVASGYLTLRALDQRLVVVKETLATRADALHYARRRAETGYTSQLEFQQAQAEYEQARQLVPAIELNIAQAENGLSILLGDNPRAIERGLALAAVQLPSVPAALPSALLRQRPDILQAEQALVAADHSLDSARAAFIPTVRLSASGGALVSNLLPDPVTIFSVGGSILAPIFEGGRLRANADAAAARRDQAAFAYRKAALTAFREVEDSLAAVQRLADQEEALVKQRDALSQAVRLASNRYRAGYSSYIEQLDAQRSLLTVELLLVQTRADRLNAAVNLYRALGGGWVGLPN